MLTKEASYHGCFRQPYYYQPRGRDKVLRKLRMIS